MCFSLIEDLDGANWLIVFYFSVLGIICNNTNEKQNEKKENKQNEDKNFYNYTGIQSFKISR